MDDIKAVRSCLRYNIVSFLRFINTYAHVSVLYEMKLVL